MIDKSCSLPVSQESESRKAAGSYCTLRDTPMGKDFLIRSQLLVVHSATQSCEEVENLEPSQLSHLSVVSPIGDQAVTT